MNSTLKTILATAAGLIAGVIIIAVVESLGHMIYPPPTGVDLKDPEQLAAIMESVPFGAKLAVLIAWGLGVFGGGLLGVKLSGGRKLPATIIAVLLLAFAGMTMMMIPHPIWMVIGALIVTVLGWYGATRFAKTAA